MNIFKIHKLNINLIEILYSLKDSVLKNIINQKLKYKIYWKKWKIQINKNWQIVALDLNCEVDNFIIVANSNKDQFLCKNS